MSKAQNKKAKFRSSAKWKKFRAYMKNKYKIDFITQRPLLKGWNLHHCDMSEAHYQNLVEDNFKCHNKQMHEVIHALFRYYVKDHTIIDRLREELDLMEKLNGKAD